MDTEKEGYVIVEWTDGFKVPIEERGGLLSSQSLS